MRTLWLSGNLDTRENQQHTYGMLGFHLRGGGGGGGSGKGVN